MRIGPTRVPGTAEAGRITANTSAPQRNPTSSPAEDTADLLAMASGVAVQGQRDALVQQLREAYLSGALKPDPERIAERLIDWGFNLGGEGIE
jgi:anti-sigma28 factor (negative regulator of flagellin synthesis)